MKKALFKAASRMMLEIVKDKNLGELTPFFDYLNNSFSYEEAMCIVEDVANSIYAKDKDLYDWLIYEIQNTELDDLEEGEVYISIVDLIHVLLDEGKLPNVDFKEHPADQDRIISTRHIYEMLVDMFGDECIEEMVEIGVV